MFLVSLLFAHNKGDKMEFKQKEEVANATYSIKRTHKEAIERIAEENKQSASEILRQILDKFFEERSKES